MSDSSTRRIIAAYVDQAPAPMFLSGFFQSPPQNFHDEEFVEIDIERDTEEIAIVIQDLSTGARQNELAGYQNKAFTPPIYDEEATINSFDLIKRQFGENPFANLNFQANAVLKSFSAFRKLENKIRRAVEQQAAQVLQTGKVVLNDKGGNPIFSLDYGPKVTHFPTVSVAWAADGSTGNPLGDIAALAEVVRQDGRGDPKELIFGAAALPKFLANAAVKAQLNNIGMQGFANLAPEMRGGGATFYGRFFIGNYWFNVWSYTAQYKSPASGLLVPYVDPDKVIMLSDGIRLDLSFGTIPRIVDPDPRVAAFLPARISGSQAGIDLSTFAWITPDGKHLKVSAGTRPLCIPTAIDQYGALDTTP